MIEEKNYYLLELDDLVEALEHRDIVEHKIWEKTDKWLDVLNEISSYIEDSANFDEGSQDLIKRLDNVIDDIYNIRKEIK